MGRNLVLNLSNQDYKKWFTLPLNTFSNLKVMFGDIAACPFMMFEKLARVVPSSSAILLIVKLEVV